jgi:hypothetical protein
VEGSRRGGEEGGEMGVGKRGGGAKGWWGRSASEGKRRQRGGGRIGLGKRMSCLSSPRAMPGTLLVDNNTICI